MPRRAYWKGHVRLSLVSFPVQLFPATDTSRDIKFHQVSRETGERVRYQTVVPGQGPIDREDIAKGYEFERGKYIVIEPEELENLRLESTHIIELVQFVDQHEIDAIYYEKPYFIVPDGSLADEAYRIICDAMRETKKAAIGQVVLGNHERIAAIKPCGRGLLLETLRYEDEVREADLYFEDVSEGKIQSEKIALAKQLISQLSAAFDPKRFSDRYEDAVRNLVETKMQGKQIKTPKTHGEGGAEIINLMDALKRSVRSETTTSTSRKPSPTKKKTPSAARSPSSSNTAKSRKRKTAT